MRTLYLLRHSLTEGNERRLYYGATDLPLSEAGRRLARERAQSRPLPECGLYVTSGLRRADETLGLLTGRRPDVALPDLAEMRFGDFEMHSYEELRDDADYRRWLDDCMGPGVMRCPNGESQSEFRERSLRGGAALLALPWETATAVIHGGPIANLMGAWFPEAQKGFYDWQPDPCEGYRVEFDGDAPVRCEVL